MKNIEDRLRQSDTKPSRQLRADFTERAIQHITEHPRPSNRWIAFKEMIRMNMRHKPVVTACAAFLLVVAAGTTYAAVNGWPTSLFGSQKTLPDGSRIVTVDTKNCGGVSAYGSKIDNKDRRFYYKVKTGSKLTNDQVTQMVQGNCEIDEQAVLATSLVRQELSKKPENKDAQTVGGYIDSTVTAVSDTSISVKLVAPIYGDSHDFTQTYNRIDPDVVVYSLSDHPARLGMKDIHVGDHISIGYRADKGAPTQAEVAPNKLDTAHLTVVSIIKNSNNIASVVDYRKYFGNEFQQVTPCKTQSSGYCTPEEASSAH